MYIDPFTPVFLREPRFSIHNCSVTSAETLSLRGASVGRDGHHVGRPRGDTESAWGVRGETPSLRGASVRSCGLLRSGCPELLCLPSVHDLRQQMTGLQSQLQQVQLERTTLSSKLKASQAEIASLQHVRQWYQQQLALAQEARVRLQGEMAHIQVRPRTCLVWDPGLFPKLSPSVFRSHGCL